MTMPSSLRSGLRACRLATLLACALGLGLATLATEANAQSMTLDLGDGSASGRIV